jgi:hypothetical protein
VGGALKRRKILALSSAEKVEVMEIQEINLEVVDSKLCSNLCDGMGDCRFSYSPARGKSGGLLFMWNGEGLIL